MGYSQPRRIEERIARELVLVLALLVLALVQSTLLPRPLGFTPNMLLLLVVCQALLSGPSSAARWAFYGGLSLDLCADTTLGSHALALLGAVLLAAVLLARIHRDNWLLPLAGSFIGAVAYHAVLAATMLILIEPVELRTYLFMVVLPSVLMALIPSLPLFLLMRWIEGRRRGEVPLDVY